MNMAASNAKELAIKAFRAKRPAFGVGSEFVADDSEIGRVQMDHLKEKPKKLRHWYQVDGSSPPR